MKKIIRTLTICLLVALLVALNIVPCFAYPLEVENQINSYKNYCENVLETFKKQLARIGVDMYPEMFDDTFIDLEDDIVCLLDIADVTASDDGFSITITPHDNAQLAFIEQTLEKQFSLLVKRVENNTIILSCSNDAANLFKYQGYIEAFSSESCGSLNSEKTKVLRDNSFFKYIDNGMPIAEVGSICKSYTNKIETAAAAAKDKLPEHFLVTKSASIFSEGSSLILIGILGVVAIAEAVVIIKLRKKHE